MNEQPTPVRGEVWYVELDPTVGQEMKKTRPAVVMNVTGVGDPQTVILPAAVVNVADVGAFALTIVVPLIGWKPYYEDYIWMNLIQPTPENGLTKDSGADAFQVRSISTERFRDRIGVLTDEQVENIAAAIAICVGY